MRMGKFKSSKALMCSWFEMKLYFFKNNRIVNKFSKWLSNEKYENEYPKGFLSL